MATVLTDDTHYKNIAAAIREKNGSDTKYKPAEMPDAIRALYIQPDKFAVSEPVAYTIADWDEARIGHTYALATPGYTNGPYGVQLGLMPDSDVTNTATVVDAALSVAEGRAGWSDVTLSAVNVPTRKFTIALFGLVPKEPPAAGKTLEEYTWSEISQISDSGLAADYFKVGDTKSVKIKGTVGTKELDLTLYVYILDINHDGDGRITFAGFLNAPSTVTSSQGGQRHVALVDDHYGSYVWAEDEPPEGELWFNWNHWIGMPDWDGTQAGGWKACDLRYDILGSTDRPPLGYGGAKKAGCIGYDATPTAATSPVQNTLMAALPSDLRNVMKPMTVYTDNVAGETGDVPENVTASVDYLPLRSQYEYYGDRDENVPQYNSAEPRRQKQYPEGAVTYYDQNNEASGYNNTGSSVSVWTRSPGTDGYDVCVKGASSSYSDDFSASLALAPVFKV